MNAILGTNTWDYCMLIDRLSAEYYAPRNRHQRGQYHRKVARPRAKKSLKSTRTDIAYWEQMNGLQRLIYAFNVRTFGKDSGHRYIRTLKSSRQ